MKTIHTDGYRALLVWLREQRTARGFSMRELAVRLNVPHSWIGKIETGERRLDLYEYLRLCTALECDYRSGIDIMIRIEEHYSNDGDSGTSKVADASKPFKHKHR